MNTFKQPWVTYLGMVIALVAILAGALGWFDPAVAWGVAGIFGFGSVASLRAYIESKGWKTYVMSGVPIIFGVLVIAGVIDAETYQLLIAAFAPITGITLQQAQVKKVK